MACIDNNRFDRLVFFPRGTPQFQKQLDIVTILKRGLC